MTQRSSRLRLGFTLIELLVVIAIIAILAAILFPVFMTAKEKGRQTLCTAHMKQIGAAVQAYMADSNDTFPVFQNWEWYPQAGGGVGTWMNCFPAEFSFSIPGYEWKNQCILNPYIKNLRMWQCPSEAVKKTGQSGGAQLSNYGYNKWYLGGGTLTSPNPGGRPKFPPRKMGEISRPSRTVLGVEAMPAWNSISPPSGRGAINCNADGWGGDPNYGSGHMATIFNNRTLPSWWNQSYGSEPPPSRWRHNGGMNVVFADGHVRWYVKGDSDLCNPDDRMWSGDLGFKGY